MPRCLTHTPSMITSCPSQYSCAGGA
jgi:hypothetical protein